VARENQTLIALRLDPQLLAAVDVKRTLKRQTRSEFVREAIYNAVDRAVPRDLIYPADRVGKSKGGRPKRVTTLKSVDEKPRKKPKIA
jgi:Ribbon-helix-helix protein, copG family